MDGIAAVDQHEVPQAVGLQISRHDGLDDHRQHAAGEDDRRDETGKYGKTRHSNDARDADPMTASGQLPNWVDTTCIVLRTCRREYGDVRPSSPTATRSRSRPLPRISRTFYVKRWRARTPRQPLTLDLRGNAHPDRRPRRRCATTRRGCIHHHHRRQTLGRSSMAAAQPPTG